MLDLAIPDLTFPKLRPRPRQVPIDLKWLLYVGCAATHRTKRNALIADGKLGAAVPSRLPMVEAVHAVLNAILEKGGQATSFNCQLYALFSFYAFADTKKQTLTPANAQKLFVDWAANLALRVTPMSAYRVATTLAQCISPVLGLESNRLMWKTKLKKPDPSSASSEKQNLERTKCFIQTVRLTTQLLPVSVVHGPLPVELKFGDEKTYVLKCSLKRKSLSDIIVTRPASYLATVVATRERVSKDTSYFVRSPLINLRIEAELLLFINQTGANLAPTLQIKGTKFSYQTSGDYLYIRPWKARAGHDVEYRVHREYRKQFDDYLAWRAVIFPDDPDGLLFPFLADDSGPNPIRVKAIEAGSTEVDAEPFRRTGWNFQASRKLLAHLEQPFVSPQTLRATAGVWAERMKAGQGSQLLGNSPETFTKDYDKPSLPRAMADITRFWLETEASIASPGPGVCVKANPVLVEDAPANAPKPDCVSGGGCLFCEHNRDQHSFEHAWKLASLRALLLRQLNADRSPDATEAGHSLIVQIERIASKLDAFKRLDSEHCAWVEEAEERMAEERYHPFHVAKFEVLGVRAT